LKENQFSTGISQLPHFEPRLFITDKNEILSHYKFSLMFSRIGSNPDKVGAGIAKYFLSSLLQKCKIT